MGGLIVGGVNAGEGGGFDDLLNSHISLFSNYNRPTKRRKEKLGVGSQVIWMERAEHILAGIWAVPSMCHMANGSWGSQPDDFQARLEGLTVSLSSWIISSLNISEPASLDLLRHLLSRRGKHVERMDESQRAAIFIAEVEYRDLCGDAVRDGFRVNSKSAGEPQYLRSACHREHQARREEKDQRRDQGHG